MDEKRENAVFGGGCFWCTEAVFKELKGVLKVEPGYAGGEDQNPTYQKVSSGRTGHAEVVRIEFDPAVISYSDLLNVFFTTHDPTSLNRQGKDVGTQYRSVVFHSSEKQRKEAEEFIQQLEKDKIFSEKIVTEVGRAGDFFPAEDYHKDYYSKNTASPYCQIVINPKLNKLREKNRELVK